MEARRVPGMGVGLVATAPVARGDVVLRLPPRAWRPLSASHATRVARERVPQFVSRRGRRAASAPRPHHTRPPRAPHPLRARRRLPPSRLPRPLPGLAGRESPASCPVSYRRSTPSRYAHARRRPRARRVRRRRARGALSRRRRGSAARVRVGPLHRPLARRLGTGRALRPPPRRRPVEPRRPRRELRVSVRPGFGWRFRSFERYVERRRMSSDVDALVRPGAIVMTSSPNNSPSRPRG